MQVINNFRAHVLQHSSAAEKIGKHELARNIVSVKQEKNEGKCSKLIDKISAQHNLINAIDNKRTLDAKTREERITHLQAKVQCNEDKLNKLLDKQDKYHKLTATTKQSSDKAEMTSAEAVSQLTSKLKESPDLLNSPGIFRISGPVNGPTTQCILENIDSLATLHSENPASLVASAIKKELDNALTDGDKVNIRDMVKKCCDDKSFIPSLDDLPKPLSDVISTCQRVVEHSDVNRMTSGNLSKIFSMRLAPTVDEFSSHEDFLKRCIEQSVTVDGVWFTRL